MFDDLAAQLSAQLTEWIRQIGHYQVACEAYDEEMRVHLTTVRDAMEDLRAYIEMVKSRP